MNLGNVLILRPVLGGIPVLFTTFVVISCPVKSLYKWLVVSSPMSTAKNQTTGHCSPFLKAPCPFGIKLLVSV